MGARHGRDALRALPRSGRAPGHLREARGLRDGLQARPLHARRLAAHPLGQAGEPGRAAPVRGAARAALRRHELEHVPGSARAAALLQVREPHPSRARGARPSRRPQRGVHRDRAHPRLEGAHRVDRRRRELPRPDGHAPRPRALPREHARDLRRPARRLARLHGAQALRARVLLDRHQRLGRQLPLRARAGAEGLLPGGPRPPRAEREHRDDRGPAYPVREAGRVPLQRQQIRGRRPRRRLHQALPALPDLQRARGRGARGHQGLPPRLHARPVAQRDRPAESHGQRGGAAARVRAGPPRRPRRPAGAQEKCDALMALARSSSLHHRRGAHPGRGPRALGGAIDHRTFRASGYRARKAEERPPAPASPPN